MPSTPARQAPFSHRPAVRFGAAVFLVVAVSFGISRLDLHPDLKHLTVAVASGVAKGNYHAIVDRLSTLAGKHGGRVENVATAGSGDNLAKLAAASKGCELQFGLVQGGLPWPEGVELVARLPKMESIFLLGKDAGAIRSFADLKGLRIGIGPEGSGTARIAEQVLALDDIAALGMVVSHHGVEEQIDLATKGELDLAVLVVDEDAAIVSRAIREKGLQMAALPNFDVVARRFGFLRTGRIGAGQFDAVRMLPPEDRRVLRVDTFVLGNRCARRSQNVGLLRVLSDAFPDLVRHNKETPNTSGLDLAPAAKAFFENGGPELVDDYLPRAGDVMPPSNWVHVAFGVSLLFNAMGFGNRFRLWRIDAARVKAEQEVAHLFGPRATLADIARMQPKAGELKPEITAGVDRVIEELEDLAARCRTQSLSVLVPMGQEMAYRYQENVIYETIGVLHAYREREREAAT